MTSSVICQMISFICFIHTLLWKCQNTVMGDGSWDITLHSISSPAERENSCTPLIHPSFSICWFPQHLSVAPEHSYEKRTGDIITADLVLLYSYMIDHYPTGQKNKGLLYEHYISIWVCFMTLCFQLCDSCLHYRCDGIVIYMNLAWVHSCFLMKFCNIK